MGRVGEGTRRAEFKSPFSRWKDGRSPRSKKAHRSHSIFRQGRTTVWTAHAVNSTFLQQDVEGVEKVSLLNGSIFIY